ncbi:BZIP domain-containing protein [Citrus sinensis]|uniref:BZIP domain-containing protein n=1 Tax=Citrus sinensis TaxID=2711 RepID=A0ACB8KT35_CITSI|nr:BZIP domain-containing protein [Citrus sinensis]
MASSKIMKSSNTRNSDLSKRSSTASSSSSTKQQQEALTDASKFASAMTVDGILRNVYNTTTASTTDATLLDAQITLVDTNSNLIANENDQNGAVSAGAMKSVDDVWREIVSGEKKEMKEEAIDEMMTLEDFLAKAGAVEDSAGGDDMDVKAFANVTERLSGGVYAFDQPAAASPFQVEGAIVGFGNGVEVVGGRGKRGRVMLEPLDKAAQQRQRRMIKNRESAARSRERKQAYQVELESLAVRLEEENEQLLKEKLMEKVVPVVEKKRPPRVLRRVQSAEW